VSSRRLVQGSILAVGGLVGVGVVQLVRALPLVTEGPQRPKGERKNEKKDKMKMGDGPRTREKKAKKGK
jgi:hypothetical protein